MHISKYVTLFINTKNKETRPQGQELNVQGQGRGLEIGL